MKILLANKFYYRRGGADIFVLNLEQILKSHGHEVAVFAMDYPDNIDTPWKKYFPSNMYNLRAFIRPFGDKETKTKFQKLLDDFKPDVVHLNNIHTQLSPIIAEIAHQNGIRVVWTLHDYKLLCPNYLCLRKGKNCELCFEPDAKKNCFKYSCMKGGKIGSWIGYMEAMKWNRERLEACTDLFVCPSQFMADKMIQGGFETSKQHHLCNFIDTEKCKSEEYTDRKDYFCYVGRLSHEKGVSTLIEAAKQLPYKLVIIGGGPIAEELKSIATDNIEFVGYKGWDEIKQLVGHARFTVIPSEWYENNPLSVIEAECLGTPVLGARIGGIPELIEENVNGMTFTSADVNDLKQKITDMWNASFDYNTIATTSQQAYSAETYYEKIMEIYIG